MRKEQKTAVVDKLSGAFRKATIAIVSEYRGMSVAETTEVRRKLRAVRGELKVAKNTLIRRAIKDTGYASLEDKLGGPVGLIISTKDPVELAKTVVGFKDLGEKFKLRGGVVDGAPVTVEQIQALATLPPKEVILAQLVGVLNAHETQLVRLLIEPGSGLVRLLVAIVMNYGEGAAAAAPAAPATEAPPAGEAPPKADAPPTHAAPTAE